MSYPRRLGKASTADLTIPIGGGRVATSVSLADLGLDSAIEAVLNVNVERKAPIVDDVYEPSAGINATADAVGTTIAAGTGTTLQAELTVLGY